MIHDRPASKSASTWTWFPSWDELRTHYFKEVGTIFAFPSITLLTLGAYFRIDYRRAVNQADNKAATVSTDSLINYELGLKSTFLDRAALLNLAILAFLAWSP